MTIRLRNSAQCYTCLWKISLNNLNLTHRKTFWCSPARKNCCRTIKQLCRKTTSNKSSLTSKRWLRKSSQRRLLIPSTLSQSCLSWTPFYWDSSTACRPSKVDNCTANLNASSIGTCSTSFHLQHVRSNSRLVPSWLALNSKTSNISSKQSLSLPSP